LIINFIKFTHKFSLFFAVANGLHLKQFPFNDPVKSNIPISPFNVNLPRDLYNFFLIEQHRESPPNGTAVNVTCLDHRFGVVNTLPDVIHYSGLLRVELWKGIFVGFSSGFLCGCVHAKSFLR